jgi:hypothetical protein
LARAFVFANHSNCEGSPRAEIGSVAQTRAIAAGTPSPVVKMKLITNNAKALAKV